MSTAFADGTSNLGNELKPKPQACLAASLFPTSTRPPARHARHARHAHATINVNTRRVRCPEAGCEWCGNAHQGGAGGSFLSLSAHPPEAASARTLSQTSASPPFPASPVFSSTGSAPGGNLGSFGSPNAGRTSATFLSSFASSPALTPPPPFPGEAISTPPQALARICEDVELRGPGAVGAPSTSPHNPKNRPVQALQGACLRADRGCGAIPSLRGGVTVHCPLVAAWTSISNSTGHPHAT
ncbi:hypothetical protein B0H14DRAFT_3449207 [Mycena olivaceomarginata]|nr:hypothetical protein B0H14DRAFT_3449207 [Mycena olivaceomarginata]